MNRLIIITCFVQFGHNYFKRPLLSYRWHGCLMSAETCDAPLYKLWRKRQYAEKHFKTNSDSVKLPSEKLQPVLTSKSNFRKMSAEAVATSHGSSVAGNGADDLKSMLLYDWMTLLILVHVFRIIFETLSWLFWPTATWEYKHCRSIYWEIKMICTGMTLLLHSVTLMRNEMNRYAVIFHFCAELMVSRNVYKFLFPNQIDCVEH